MSENGANFYGLPLNEDSLILEKKSHVIPNSFTFCNDILIPYKAGQTCNWSIKQSNTFLHSNI